MARNIFCPECDGILDITKSNPNPKNIYNFDKSNSTSEDVNVDKIGTIIDNINNNINVENIGVELEQIKNHSKFQNLSKSEQQKLLEKIEKKLFMNKLNNINQAFYICKSCNWAKPIEPGTEVLSKISLNNVNNTNIFIDQNKNNIYSNILPFTRNYTCPNKKCVGNTEPIKHEAVMKRVNMKVIYTCCACQSVF